MVAVGLEKLYAAAAKERQRESGKTHGRGQEKVVAPVPQAKAREQAASVMGVGKKPDPSAPGQQGKAAEQAAETMGVSPRSVASAKVVVNEGAAAECLLASSESKA